MPWARCAASGKVTRRADRTAGRRERNQPGRVYSAAGAAARWEMIIRMIERSTACPLHVLIVHAVVVFIPLAALLTVLSAVWPAARRRLGIVTPIVALLALILVPFAANAGEWLQARVCRTPADRSAHRARRHDAVVRHRAVRRGAAGLGRADPAEPAVGRHRPPWIGVVVAVVAIALSGGGRRPGLPGRRVRLQGGVDRLVLPGPGQRRTAPARPSSRSPPARQACSTMQCSFISAA